MRAGVHAILGSDSFRAEEALEALLDRAVGRDRQDAVQVLRGDETSWGRVVESAGMRSLFADRRAIVVRGAEGLKGEGEGLAGYLDDPTPGVTLVLLAAKPDKRRALWKKILDKAEVVTVEPLKGRALRAFVEDRLRQRSLRLTEDGLEELLERVGQDLRRLMGEVDKLEAFAGGGRGPLSAEEVAAVLGRGLARPLYRLGDAMAARRPAELLEGLEEILEDGESPQRLLAALHRSLRQVRGAKALKEARASREAIVSRLGLLPFKAGDVLEAASRWSEAELREALRALGLADRRMKTGTDARAAFAAAVAEACRRREARSAPRPGR